MTLLIIAIIFGFYVAWNIGANDVANAMGTSVGSGALTLKRAVILAAILEFSGAFLLGSHVSETVESGIVNPAFFENNVYIYAYGMLASLLAAGVWLQIASYFGWPVSTTHSIVGALVGFGLVSVGAEAIEWGNVLFIVSSWVISPLMGGVIAFITFMVIRRRIFGSDEPVNAAKRITPLLVFLIFALLSLVLLFKGIPELNIAFWPAIGLALAIGIVAYLVARLLIRRIPEMAAPEGTQPRQVGSGIARALKYLRRAQGAAKGELQEEVTQILRKTENLKFEASKAATYEGLEVHHRTVERIFAYLQIVSACFMAFAHGANDVANAIGPLSAVVNISFSGIIDGKSYVPLWVLGLGGVGIVFGLATWGWRVIKTVGKRITELTPTRGFSAEFGSALTIVLASRLGLPISTTHTLVGAILGVGIARGIGAINLNVVRNIFVSWVVTIPVGALLAILFYHGLLWIF